MCVITAMQINLPWSDKEEHTLVWNFKNVVHVIIIVYFNLELGDGRTFLSKFMLIIWFLKSIAICYENKESSFILFKWNHWYSYSLELICHSLDYFWIFRKGKYRNHCPEVSDISKHFLGTIFSWWFRVGSPKGYNCHLQRIIFSYEPV